MPLLFKKIFVFDVFNSQSTTLMQQCQAARFRIFISAKIKPKSVIRP